MEKEKVSDMEKIIDEIKKTDGTQEELSKEEEAELEAELKKLGYL